MLDSFKTLKLGDISEIFAGGDKPKNFSEVQNKKHNIPVYANGETNNGLQGYTNTPRIVESAVTVTARGSNVGFVAVRKEPFFPIVRLLCLIPNKELLDVDYLFYNLKQNRQNGTGSGQPQITIPDISNRSISLPSLFTQQKNAKVLSDLDAKISLNNKINIELEQMAKTLYTYWFEQFDFPDANGKPYKSSGGEMVYNIILKREIPKGWEVKNLENIVSEFTKGTTTSYVEKSNLINLNQKVNKGFNLERQYFKFLDETLSVPNSKYAKQKDILINSLGQGTLGRIHFFLDDVNNIVVDQHLFILRVNFNNISPSYLYNTLNSTAYQIQIERQITGSTGMQMLNASNLKDLKIIIPESKISNDFEKKAFLLYEKVTNNVKQNQELTKLRDWLLPMLMNGQVTVGDAEEMVMEQLDMVAEQAEIYPQKVKNIDEKVKKVKASPIKLNPLDVYKRTLLAAEIVFQLKETFTLGHLKLQKMLYLSQEIENMALPMNFLRQAMGPYDNQLARSLDKQFETKKWFKYHREASLKYQPLEKCGQHRDDFEKYFENQLEGINYLIKKFSKFTSTQIEAVATLYACWKEAIGNHEFINDKLIITKFYNWSKEKEKFQEDNLVKALDWMRNNGIVPK